MGFKIVALFFALLLPHGFVHAAPCEPVSRELKGPDSIIRITERLPEGNFPEAVILVPPTGGTNLIDRSYASGLCEKGIGAIILDGWKDDDEYNLELEIHTRFYRRAQAAIDLLADQLKGKSIGLLGTSVGALHGAIAFARNDKIHSAFLIVGGGDIASIIAHSDQDAMVTAKTARFKLYGFHSEGEYVTALRKVIPFEPMELKFERSKKKLGMIISTNDSTVPSQNQILLRDKWLPDVEYKTSWSHVFAIIKAWLFDKSKVIDFFAGQATGHG